MRPRTDVFAQLEAKLGQEFYPKLNSLLLDEKPKFNNDQERIDFFALAASKVSQKDLARFFIEDWRIPISESSIRVIFELNLNDPKIDTFSLNPYSRESLKRDVFIRYTNNTKDILTPSGNLVPTGEVIVFPESVIPSETGVFRVGIKENEDLIGNIVFQRGKDQNATVRFD